jgi:hypothetical protein
MLVGMMREMEGYARNAYEGLDIRPTSDDIEMMMNQMARG